MSEFFFIVKYISEYGKLLDLEDLNVGAFLTYHIADSQGIGNLDVLRRSYCRFDFV